MSFGQNSKNVASCLQASSASAAPSSPTKIPVMRNLLHRSKLHQLHSPPKRMTSLEEQQQAKNKGNAEVNNNSSGASKSPSKKPVWCSLAGRRSTVYHHDFSSILVQDPKSNAASKNASPSKTVPAMQGSPYNTSLNRKGSLPAAAIASQVPYNNNTNSFIYFYNNKTLTPAPPPQGSRGQRQGVQAGGLLDRRRIEEQLRQRGGGRRGEEEGGGGGGGGGQGEAQTGAEGEVAGEGANMIIVSHYKRELTTVNVSDVRRRV